MSTTLLLAGLGMLASVVVAIARTIREHHPELAQTHPRWYTTLSMIVALGPDVVEGTQAALRGRAPPVHASSEAEVTGRYITPKFPPLPVLLTLACFVSCAPSQHDEARYGMVRVGLGAPLDDAGPWREDQLAALLSELGALDSLGPRFVAVDEGSAQVVVRPFDSGASCGHGVGRYAIGADYVEVDPACTRGYDELKAAVAHEIGHWLGMRHVCMRGGETSDCDDAVGYGAAVMNPRVAYDATCAGCGPDDSVATTMPTALDLREYLKTR